MPYCITFLIAFCFCNPVKAQNRKPTYNPPPIALRKLNEGQLKADFGTLEHALVETYGGIYRLSDSIHVQKRFDKYRRQLAIINDQADFISLLTTLIASFREGHMKVEYDDETNNLLKTSKLFPFTIMVENEKLRVLYNETAEDQSITPGMEILSINGHQSGSLIKAMIPHISADGYGYSHRNKRLADNFSQNLWLYFGQQDRFNIKAKNSTGKVIITNVVGVTDAHRQINRLSIVNLQVRKGVTQFEGRGPNVSLSFTNEGKTANLRIQGFKGKEFENELDSVFRIVDQKNTKTLILDLRSNGGGEDVYGAALVSHLTSAPFRYFRKIQMRTIKPSFGGWSHDLLNILDTGTVTDPVDRHLLTGAIKAGINIQQPSSINFKGKLFVLTDGYTFSTAADAAAVIRQITTAIFIGEETGGGAEGNTSGIFLQAKLPNSGLKVIIPSLCYWNAVTVRKKNRGVLPDHPLINSVTDILESNDRQWKYAAALALESD
ncbi:S41 family peptidase [Dyadobacter chenwenxiniae]|uniref:S41 family peptidase n=1 Tax=Dyadobacter chenwenxiniae TaxID=2906456 RepID=A0A9X1TII5_9BACT|nr:S41 family peptidase [Dyadobacter chenwenxiniae]MCF0065559.1 S41 family peptidase [Dyadobacter chenwenxiniae]UON85469.1 S41 family peptidase [Dyadobacter chenwenxiniae]